MHHRVSRLLLGCILLSLLLHFIIGPLLVWLFGDRSKAPGPQEVVFVTRSSALKITHRVRPAPPRPRTRPIVQQQPQPRAQPHKARAAAQPRDLARITPRATIALPKRQRPITLAQIDTQAQEQAFEKTIAKLRQANDPVLSIAQAKAAPEAIKRYKFNAFGAVSQGPLQEGLLQPVPGKSWRSGGYDYYYVRYWVEYGDGTTETGVVPWPLHYLPAQDPFLLHIEHIPLPTPMPDFQLAPGTALQPLIAFCLSHRNVFVTCPIARD